MITKTEFPSYDTLYMRLPMENNRLYNSPAGIARAARARYFVLEARRIRKYGPTLCHVILVVTSLNFADK